MHEELRHIVAHDLFEQDDPDGLSFLRRQNNDSVKTARNLYDGKVNLGGLALFPTFCSENARARVFAACQKSCYVERFIAHQRKRSRRIDGHRCENRINLFAVILLDERLFFRRKVFILLYDESCLLFQSRNQHAIVSRILQADEIVRSLKNRLELLRCRHAGDVRLLVARMLHVLEACDTDHEELIEV